MSGGAPGVGELMEATAGGGLWMHGVTSLESERCAGLGIGHIWGGGGVKGVSFLGE